uniref:Uncharacterized protein n=1 Tax=Human herpesvirus 2 TaxID=10310 RepID=A0A481TSB1_HHV2|nr:hypothetical protein [Human alphaherpesvirus 2]
MTRLSLTTATRSRHANSEYSPSSPAGNGGLYAMASGSGARMHAASTTVSSTRRGGHSATHDGRRGPQASRGSAAHSSLWARVRSSGPAGAGSNTTSSPEVTRFQDVLGAAARHDTTQTPTKNTNPAPRAMFGWQEPSVGADRRLADGGAPSHPKTQSRGGDSLNARRASPTLPPLFFFLPPGPRPSITRLPCHPGNDERSQRDPTHAYRQITSVYWGEITTMGAVGRACRTARLDLDLLGGRRATAGPRTDGQQHDWTWLRFLSYRR